MDENHESKQVGSLLGDLCVIWGFCLPPDAIARMCDNPPVDAEAFTEEVYGAEGMLPATNLTLYRQVRNYIAERYRSVE
ncbi:MAG TPA: hypothetical protein VHY91_19425 [Pirellulales bacterium]|jgi:hypothetical protein|nr:hypothetical protein [Pirellulales bacterium]